MEGQPPRSTLFPTTPLSRSPPAAPGSSRACWTGWAWTAASTTASSPRSEEHTSELQSRQYLVCRLLLEKKNTRGRLVSFIHLAYDLTLVTATLSFLNLRLTC